MGPDMRESASISDAAVFNITDLGFGKGYTVQEVSGGGAFVSLAGGKGDVALSQEMPPTFDVFSVTKSTDSGQGFLG